MVFEAMPENPNEAGEWLKRLSPEAFDSVWVASAVHFAEVSGAKLAPFCSILNAVRERFRMDGVVQAAVDAESIRDIRRAVAQGIKC